jgi:hypothetical protein
MFRAGDTVVGLLDKIYGDYGYYVVIRVHGGGPITLYDIRAIKTGILYTRVPLPEEYYKKLDKVR